MQAIMTLSISVGKSCSDKSKTEAALVNFRDVAKSIYYDSMNPVTHFEPSF
jgi:hypothetical protein